MSSLQSVELFFFKFTGYYGTKSRNVSIIFKHLNKYFSYFYHKTDEGNKYTNVCFKWNISNYYLVKKY